MSLYLKYRPKTLEEIEGNEEVVEALSSIIKKDKPHSYLFTGPSGTGKTTCARILKDMLHCSEMDYKEIDSADFRGVDTIREIRRNMMYKPSNGSCRIFYLDEVHQLTKDAQNALLKALEDTPSHVYFFLSTTEPEKLLQTIKTRCSTFSLSLLPERRMMRLMKRILSIEGKEVSEEVLKQICIDSMGSPRMALVILDKIIDVEPDKMLAVAKQIASKENQVIELCRALLERKPWKVIMPILKGIERQEPEKIRRAVLSYCSKVLLNSDNPQAVIILNSFKTPTYDSGMAGIIISCYECVN